METKHTSSTQLICVYLALLLTSAACGSAAVVETETPVVIDAEPSISAPPTESPAQQAGEVVLTTSDPCNMLTRENVEAGFGKPVKEVKPEDASIGIECTFVFDENTVLRVASYDGEDAVNYFAVLVTAGKQDCEELFESLFEIAFAPLTERYPSADVSLLELPLGDLYRQYIEALGGCMYIHTEGRADVGNNVIATETIFLNWSSSVAVLSEDRVVEFTYQEPIPSDAETELQSGSGKEEFYALAEPYRDEVLVGYTEILIALLRQAIGQ